MSGLFGSPSADVCQLMSAPNWLATAFEIKRLDPVSIVVVGGTGVISNAVANQLGALIN